MLLLKLFLLATLSIDFVFCETASNNTTALSRREILEQQARTAYQNTCYRLQELSNWMTAVFRIKSVWASATVNEIAARSEGLLEESDRLNRPGLPPRSKTTGNECSLSSIQVTAQTYAYLQSQLMVMKWFMGRNMFKFSKEKLEGANVSLRERMKMLDAFNATLNDVVSKLRQNTENTSAPVDSEAWRAGNIIKDVQEGRFLQFLQRPKILLMNMLDDQVQTNQTRNQTERRSFFQNLGKNLDKIIFSAVPVKQNTTSEHSVANKSMTDVVMFPSIL